MKGAFRNSWLKLAPNQPLRFWGLVSSYVRKNGINPNNLKAVERAVQFVRKEMHK